jgi:hypothetical protein
MTCPTSIMLCHHLWSIRYILACLSLHSLVNNSINVAISILIEQLVMLFHHNKECKSSEFSTLRPHSQAHCQFYSHCHHFRPYLSATTHILHTTCSTQSCLPSKRITAPIPIPDLIPICTLLQYHLFLTHPQLNHLLQLLQSRPMPNVPAMRRHLRARPTRKS